MAIGSRRAASPALVPTASFPSGPVEPAGLAKGVPGPRVTGDAGLGHASGVRVPAAGSLPIQVRPAAKDEAVGLLATTAPAAVPKAAAGVVTALVGRA